MNNPDELAGLSASRTTGYGPCRVCGATGYSLSYGGADICPACDAGIPPDVTRLRQRAERAEAELAATMERITTHGFAGGPSLDARVDAIAHELAALKRSPQGTVHAVRPQADGRYLVEVRCDSAAVASLFMRRVALLPVGGE